MNGEYCSFLALPPYLCQRFPTNDLDSLTTPIYIFYTPKGLKPSITWTRRKTFCGESGVGWENVWNQPGHCWFGFLIWCAGKFLLQSALYFVLVAVVSTMTTQNTTLKKEKINQVFRLFPAAVQIKQQWVERMQVQLGRYIKSLWWAVVALGSQVVNNLVI